MSRQRFVHRGTAIVVLVLAAGLMGCDEDTTGTSEARMTAVVHDENPGSQSVKAASLLPLQAAAGFDGTFSGDARVEISADGETWVELGDAGEIDVALQSSGDEATVHGDVAVPLEAATRARLVLSGATADIDAGSTIGGITLDSAVGLSIGSSNEVVIEKQFEQSVDLGAGSTTTVTFDLNSEAWVTQESVEATVVQASEVQSAVTAEVQTSGS